MTAKKNILVIGSGGREHAMVIALKRSPQAGKIFALPGNGGINQDAKHVNLSQTDFPGISNFCKQNKIAFVVVGPEQPLVEGIVDFLSSEGIRVFGPNKVASQLEGSKDFMKEIVWKYNIPTAEYKTFINAEEAKKYVTQKGAPIVIKTDGLAAGKGVTVAMDIGSAINAVDEAFAGKFGDAGKKLIVEEFLEGEEASFFIITDGKTSLEFGSAQDHKRAFDGDKGPNTGGMGTYSPAPIVTDEISGKVMSRIIEPTIKGLNSEGITYKGFLFAGLMIDKNGEPKLIEYNIRLGDPEAQTILSRLDSDLVDVIEKAIDGNLSELKEVKFRDDYALCVVMAAKGYPEDYEKNLEIDLSGTRKSKSKIIYHAGTALKDGKLVSSGGRVLGVTGIGKNINQAFKNAYIAVKAIRFPGGFYRTDIGWRELKRIQKEANKKQAAASPNRTIN